MLLWVLALCSTPFLNLLNIFYMYIVQSRAVEEQIVITVNKGTNNTVKVERDVIAKGQQYISILSRETKGMQKNRQTKNNGGIWFDVISTTRELYKCGFAERT